MVFIERMQTLQYYASGQREVNMVTKLEVLALYNAERGTTYTLTTLATELLMQALKAQWAAEKQRQLIIEDII